MNLNRIKKLISGSALVLATAFGLMLVSGTDANAQGRGQGQRDNGRNDRYDDRYDDRYGRNDGYGDDEDRYNGRDRNGNQSVRFAFQQGYRAGLKEGRQSARNGGYGNYGNGSGYGNGNGNYGNNGAYGNGNGNRNGWGNSGAWQQAYNAGVRLGYREAIDRTRNNRRNPIARPF
jgi:hypothetical protein